MTRRIYSSFVLNGQAIRKRSAPKISSLNSDFANDDGWAPDPPWGMQEALYQPPVSDEFPLKICDGEAWGTHFHAWLGRSKKRYICSVFPFYTNQPLGGLPEFFNAIALAVAYERGGRRICRSLFPFSWVNGVYSGSEMAAAGAVKGGAQEWHVHLLAQTLSERRAALDDLRYLSEHCAGFAALPEREDMRQSACRQ